MITDKEILDVIENMKGIKNPDTFQLNPHMAEAIWKVIRVTQAMGGAIEVVFDKTKYKIKVTKPKPTKREK